MQAPVQVTTAKKYDLWLDGLPAMVSQQQLSLWQVKGPKPLCNCCKDSVAAFSSRLLGEQHHAGNICS